MTTYKKKLVHILLFFIFVFNQRLILAEQYAKDNGDIYVKSDYNRSAVGTDKQINENINLDEVMTTCNSSFSIPMDYIVQFNSTGELPNIIDKTGPCYIRCFYEKSGFIDNWKLNLDRIRQFMWPVTADSIEVCQEEGKNETNTCLRTYAIAKCLMIRALVDAPSTIH